MAFYVDTKGENELLNRKSDDDSDEEPSEGNNYDIQIVPLVKKTDKKSDWEKDDFDFSSKYLDFDRKSLRTEKKLSLKSLVSKFNQPEKILEKSVLQPGFEKLHSLPSYEEDQRRLKKQRKLDREKTKGKDWFNMPAPQVTEEMKNDLEVLQMRSALDTKQFYKKNDLKVLPKYFQVGRIVESAADFYHSRIPKKERKKTLVDELLADAEFQKSTKKRYKTIIAERKKTHFKAHRQAQKLKKKKT